MARATIANMGIYDRCEKDVKNCRPHSLKPEEGLLRYIRIFFVCLYSSDTKGDKIIKTVKMLDRCTWRSSRLRAAMPIVHVTFRRLYHTSLIKLHFADHSMYRYCFSFFFFFPVYITCLCSLSLFTILRVHDMLKYYKTDFHLRHHCPQFSLLCRCSQSVMENCNKSTKQIALI